MIERAQRTDDAAHDRHRMGVTPETAVKASQLLVQHRVPHHALVEYFPLGLRRQLAVQQQVGDLEEVGLFGQLIDRVAAMQQHAFIAVDVGDLALARRRCAIADVVGEYPKIAVELADISRLRPDGAGLQRDGQRLVRAIEGHGERPVGGAAHALFLSKTGRAGIAALGLC